MKFPGGYEERLLSYVECTFILLFAAMLFGPGLSYVALGTSVLSAVGLLLVSGQWRRPVSLCFLGNAGIWAVTGLFALISLVVCGFSDASSLRGLAEVKWILIWMALLLPASVFFRRGDASRTTRVAAWAMIALVVLSAAGGLIQALTAANPLRELTGRSVDNFGFRATGFLRNPITFGHLMGGIFWVSAAGAAVAFAWRDRATLTMAGIACLASLGSVIMSQARGVWFAFPIVALVSILLLRGRMRGDWIRVVGVCAVLGVGVLVASESTRERFVSAFDTEERGVRHRLELWQVNLSILRDHPFGLGYGASTEIIKERFDDRGFEYHGATAHPHNEFMVIATGSGLPGVGLYLVLCGWLFARAFVAARRLDPFSTGQGWPFFLLFASALLQVFTQVCALTDQMGTPGRIMLCVAWAIAIAVPVELEEAGRAGDGGGRQAV